MGLCSGEKRKRACKTIIIPRGIIDPNENNIIEIPINLDANSSLIVKAPTDENPAFSVEPYRGNFKDIQDIDRRVETTRSYPDALPRAQPIDFTPQSRLNIDTQPQLPFANTSKYQANLLGTQTQLPSATRYQNNSQQTSSVNIPTYNYNPPPSSPPEIHSPLCPICARASCSFNYPSPRRYTPPSPCVPVPRCYAPSYCEQGVRFPECPSSEDAMLSKMLNDKIDKILKPMLFSLAKSTLDDLEREIDGKPCSIDETCSPNYSRRQCDIRRNSSPYAYSSSSRRTSIPDIPDYDTFRSEAKKRETRQWDPEYSARYSRGRGGGYSMSSRRSNDNDYDSRRSADKDSDDDYTPRKYCPPQASCQKRTNVSFGEKDDESQNDRDLLNTAMILGSNESLTAISRKKGNERGS